MVSRIDSFLIACPKSTPIFSSTSTVRPTVGRGRTVRLLRRPTPAVSEILASTCLSTREELLLVPGMSMLPAMLPDLTPVPFVSRKERYASATSVADDGEGEDRPVLGGNSSSNLALIRGFISVLSVFLDDMAEGG